MTTESEVKRMHVPGPIAVMPGVECVGRKLVLFDVEIGGEVLATVVEFLPNAGPIWHMEIGNGSCDSMSVFIGPDGSSNVGRWHVLREADQTSDILFAALDTMGPYPAGTEAVCARILGTAFFPGGSGLWRESVRGTLPTFPVGGIMVIGQDFDSRVRYDRSLERGQENLDGPTWCQLLRLFASVGIAREECFFTNAYMGLRTGASSVGEYPGTNDIGFAARCQAFLLRQLRAQRPRAILALGLPAVRMLGRLAPNALKPWCEANGFAAVDEAEAAVVHGVSFPESESVVATAVALVHPSYRQLNVKRRRFRTIDGTLTTEANAERAMLDQALKAPSTDR